MQRIQVERQPRRSSAARDEVLPLDPRDPEIVRVKQGDRAIRAGWRSQAR